MEYKKGVLRMHITLKGDSVMKKNISKIYLGIIIILYNVFSYIYATDGLKIQLATKIQNNKYDYIKYNTLWSLSRFIY